MKGVLPLWDELEGDRVHAVPRVLGRKPLTDKDMAEMAFAVTGRKPKIRVAGKTMLRVIGLFNPLMREMVEMHYLQTNPVLLDDSALTNLLGSLKKTPYPEGVRQSVEYLQQQP